MSVENFQIALAQLIASPKLSVNFSKDPKVIFEKYDLSGKEQSRLLDIVCQKGMVANHNLFRFNKVTPIYTQLPYTCLLLGSRLVAVLEKFWELPKPTDLQFNHEVIAFSDYLLKNIPKNIKWLKDIILFETAINTLNYNKKQIIKLILTQNPALIISLILENKHSQLNNLKPQPFELTISMNSHDKLVFK